MATPAAKVTERRSAPRMVLDAAAIIRFENTGTGFRSRVLNVSRNGILLAMPAPRPVGTRMHITVRISEPAMEIKLTGIVAHVAENPTGQPGFTTVVGLYLTEMGADWQALCQHLAEQK